MILHITIVKFSQQTRHAIFLLNSSDSVDLIKMAPSSEESGAASRGSGRVGWHPPGSVELSKRRAEMLHMQARCFQLLYFTWTDLYVSLPDSSVSCRKGSFKNYFKSLFILKSFAVSMATFPQSHHNSKFF